MRHSEEYYQKLRQAMVEQQIIARGVKDPRVIKAMETVPRHKFLPPEEAPFAYEDEPRPIGQGQTISQPYIVAFMTEQLHLKPTDRVLEIGTGSGYQAAVLAEIADSVFTIEIIPELAQSAAKRLKALGYDNVVVRQGDGYNGWPEKAPFDAIIVTAAPPKIPPPLLEQLKNDGTMVLPVGKYVQELVVVKKSATGMAMQNILPVRFVPMTGKVQKEK
ncbi:protein-L-isoaspartate O-methyltransferase [candidate division KSB1 bacterium]|nr:MAG: protein-L-isoaspartate O-methyltransferase [candidate division KSB1 bacterium]